MKPALLLIDLQNDFLRAPDLVPAAGQVVDRAVVLLNGARKLNLPIIHVQLTVNPENEGPDTRMPHWKRENKWACMAGTEGHLAPESLQPLENEPIIHKQFFSAFEAGTLDTVLADLEVDTLVMAGVHLHGCIRSSALDAYQRGYAVLIAEDAVASDDPIHAAITRRYLERRAARFVSVQSFLESVATPIQQKNRISTGLPCAMIGGESLEDPSARVITHFSPRDLNEALWAVPICDAKRVGQAVTVARETQRHWQTVPVAERTERLMRLADLLEDESEAFARQMAIEVGKPITQGRGEVRRTAALLRALKKYEGDALETQQSEALVRSRPLGVVAVITPWNNPLAIPLGKIGPALFYGNTVVWKPAPPGTGMALKCMELFHKAGLPAGVVSLVCGDHSTATSVIGGSDGVTFSGSLLAGYAIQEICARHNVSLQAELGGNNAAIVWDDCDLEDAAQKVAEAAFGFSGQRCTANRRVIVADSCYDVFLEHLKAATAQLVWGDPLEEGTQIGPLVSKNSCERVATLVERARPFAEAIITPHQNRLPNGAYFPPTIICCDNPRQEIVQEETFGPVLVVQRAQGWNHAMQLCNGVKQGLVAALFSRDSEKQSQFLSMAQAGILKINRGTADAGAEVPFSGWKASGIGPPEHGHCNREFYTRIQTVYTNGEPII